MIKQCSDERACINCFSDQGECLGSYKKENGMSKFNIDVTAVFVSIGAALTVSMALLWLSLLSFKVLNFFEIQLDYSVAFPGWGFLVLVAIFYSVIRYGLKLEYTVKKRDTPI